MEPAEILTNALFYIAAAIGGATLIVDGLERFAKITPSTKDDEWVSKAKQRLGVVAAVLDRLAMNKRGQ